jgi:hypothetical protein
MCPTANCAERVWQAIYQLREALCIQVTSRGDEQLAAGRMVSLAPVAVPMCTQPLRGPLGKGRGKSSLVMSLRAQYLDIPQCWQCGKPTRDPLRASSKVSTRLTSERPICSAGCLASYRERYDDCTP